MSADKVITVYGAEALIEASYGAGGTFTPASDGVLLAEETVVAATYIHAGDRAMAVASAGELPQATPSGFQGEVTIPVEIKGTGATYSASVWPDFHNLLRMCGHSATGDFTVSAEKWTYAPISSAYESGAVRLFARGEQWDLTGVYGSFGFVIEGPGFARGEFALQGILADPADAAPPAITYDTVLPPKAENITLAIGGAWSTAKVRRISFQQGLTVNGRADINATTAHAGFAIGRRAPRLEIQVEAAAFSTFNPFAARKVATAYDVTFQVGSVQYNRMKFQAPQAQIIDVVPDADDPVGLWTLTFKVPTSGGATANDDYNIVFD